MNTEESFVEERTWASFLRQYVAPHVTVTNIRKVFTPTLALATSFLFTLSMSSHTLILSLCLTLYVKRWTETDGFLRLLQKFQRFVKRPLLILNCKLCRRSSCVACHSEWTPLHICHEHEQESFRLFVEKAMSNAMVRTVTFLVSLAYPLVPELQYRI